MKKKYQKHLVTWNEVSVEQRNEINSASPYRQYIDTMQTQEPVTANPDSLADTPSNRLWGAGVPPQLAELIIERFADETGSFPILSKKQNEVLRLTLMGLTVTQVARKLKLSHPTVSNYLKRISLRFKRLLKTVDL